MKRAIRYVVKLILSPIIIMIYTLLSLGVYAMMFCRWFMTDDLDNEKYKFNQKIDRHIINDLAAEFKNWFKY